MSKDVWNVSRQATESGSCDRARDLWPAPIPIRGLHSPGRAGGIWTRDFLTPRTMRHAPPAKTATGGA